MLQSNPPSLTLTNCDREPIHIPGSIQPHGFLLALCTGEIEYYSSNWPEGHQPPLGRPWNHPCLVQYAQEIDNLRAGEPARYLGQGEICPGVHCDILAHLGENGPIIEFEPVAPLDGAPPGYWSTRSMASLEALHRTRSLHDLCQTLADEIRNLSGFDRVMIYRFHADWHGEVVAESRIEEAYGYLGHHFPASDIPVQAREIFRKNWTRSIVDVDYQPVSLVGMFEGQTLNLERAVLRSVSPIHLQYLRNMEVGSTMTVSLICEGQLWGLVACHHSCPKHLSAEIRQACEIPVRLASSLLQSRRQLDDQHYRGQLTAIHQKLLHSMAQEPDLVAGLVNHSPNLLDLADAEGAAAAIHYEGRWTLLGNTPALEDIDALANWLAETGPSDGVFATHELPALFPAAAAYKDVASGLMAFSIPKSERNYVIWFRPEWVSSVTWAGNPDKQVKHLPDGSVRIEPRHSFDAWTQICRLQSRPWKEVEMEAASELRNAIIALDLQRQFQLEQQERRRSQRAQRQLRASERRFRALADSLPHLVWATDRGGRVRYVNQHWHDYFGSQRIQQLDWQNWIHPDDAPAAVAAIKVAQQNGKSWEREFRLRHQDGRYNWFLVRAVPLCNGNEQVLRWHGTCTDVQQHKEAEQLLASSERAAERANEAKSAFLAHMSHEIRTPMTAVLGYAELLLQTLTDPDHRSSVEVIQQSGRYLLEIVNEILDLSKIEAGRLEVELAPTALVETIQQVLSLIEVRAQQKGLTLVGELSGPLPITLQTDAGRLRQVMLNLLGNAIKFTDQGSVRLKVHLSACAAYVEFHVLDTGIGMDDSQIARLFQPFTQVDHSVARRLEGTGLGLTICKHLVERLGGSIGVESQIGQGSDFYFRVPVGESPLQQQCLQVTSNPQPIQSTTEHDLSGVRVLVSDDREDIRQLVQGYLQTAGAEVLLAENGQQVLERIEGFAPHLVVLDMQMPLLDGYETAQQLRSRKYDAPIIALTASAMRGDRKRCLDAGCNEYLSKPLHREELLSIASRLTRPSTATRVLVVEDNPMAGAALKGILQSLGCTVEVANSGAKALHLTEQLRPQLALIDFELPDMSGADLLVSLRSIAPQLRCIAHTGHDLRENVHGFDGVLQKPAGLEQLKGLVSQL